MNNAQKYFSQQLENKEFKNALNTVSEQVDIEWELERVKNQIKNDVDKNVILSELEKLQNFVHNTMFASNLRSTV
jgi:methionine salvage enolase-phosphatase E1